VIGAISPTAGLLHWEIRVGGTNKETYTAFLTTLFKHPFMLRGSRKIIDDNAGIHRAGLIQEIIEGAAVEHTSKNLPPYSPQLNPIEEVWNQVKSYVKDQIHESEANNTPVELRQWIRDGLLRITPENCNNYMDHVMRVYTVCLERQPLH